MTDDENTRLRARIEALEAALRDIMNHPEEERRTGEPSYSVKWAFWNIQNIARAALAPEQKK
jgi:hypothetical protein